MMLKPAQRFIVPRIFQTIPFLVAGVSTRHGGLSTGNYNSLNLGKHTADQAEIIQQNIELLCHDLGIDAKQLARAYQCHGDAILECAEGGYQENYDAIIATATGVIAGVGIADCCPILVVDPVTKKSAAIHAGWKGTVAQIVRKTVEQMIIIHHSKPENIKAWIGPCISAKHFEVGNEVATHFAANEKTQVGETYFVDLKKANLHQLQSLGIQSIEIAEYCTVEHNELFYSHRKENGITGRMMAFIGFKM